MKKEKEVDLKKEVRYPITLCSIVLSLLGISAFIIYLPDVLALDFRSVISAVSALCIILGVIGMIRLTRWGLYFLAFSIVLPVIFFFFQATTQYIILVSFINLLIFIDVLLVYKAHGCKDIELQKKLIKISKKYIFYISIALLAILIAIAASILSVAFGNSRARGVMRVLDLDGVVSKVQEVSDIGNR